MVDKMIGMAKDKITVTVDPDVLRDVDADAAAAGLNRSEYVQKVLRDAHLARLLSRVEPQPPLPAGEEKSLRGLLRWQAGLYTQRGPLDGLAA